MVKSSLFKWILLSPCKPLFIRMSTLNMSQRSNCDIIVINLQIDFSFNWGDQPSASNLTSKKELKSPPHRMVVSSSKTKLLIISLISDKTVI